MALTDTEVLTACVDFTLQRTHEAEQQTFKELETSGATRLVNALRVLRLQRAILAVGMFSMFEALRRKRWVESIHQHLGKVSTARVSIVEHVTGTNQALHIREGRGRVCCIGRNFEL